MSQGDGLLCLERAIKNFYRSMADSCGALSNEEEADWDTFLAGGEVHKAVVELQQYHDGKLPHRVRTLDGVVDPHVAWIRLGKLARIAKGLIENDKDRSDDELLLDCKSSCNVLLDWVDSSTGKPRGNKIPAELNPKGFFAPSDIASNFDLNLRNLNSRLGRWRKAHAADTDYYEVSERKPREPKYLYRYGAIKDIIDDMRRGTV